MNKWVNERQKFSQTLKQNSNSLKTSKGKTETVNTNCSHFIGCRLSYSILLLYFFLSGAFIVFSCPVVVVWWCAHAHVHSTTRHTRYTEIPWITWLCSGMLWDGFHYKNRIDFTTARVPQGSALGLLLFSLYSKSQDVSVFPTFAILLTHNLNSHFLSVPLSSSFSQDNGMLFWHCSPLKSTVTNQICSTFLHSGN